MMTLRGMTFRDQLIDAARNAGEQLELWKPMALIHDPFLHASWMPPSMHGAASRARRRGSCRRTQA
jgi:hypothetical protein